MKIKKVYDHKNKTFKKVAELTKGEQYQLMKDNQRMIKAEPNWEQIFRDTVSFADRDIVYVDEYPTESANLTFD